MHFAERILDNVTVTVPDGSTLKPDGAKKIVYVDMDNVLVNFQSGIDRLPEKIKALHYPDLDDVPGIFSLMDPMPMAVESFLELLEKFDTYILSTAPWKNSSAWSDKVEWVQRYLGQPATKRLILTHHKNLNRGDFLIDDRVKHGAGKFVGEHIQFGRPPYPDWPAVMTYLRGKATAEG